MKKLLIALLLAIPLLGSAQNAYDSTARQRNASNDGWQDRWYPMVPSGAYGLMGMSGTTLLPNTYQLGTGFSIDLSGPLPIVSAVGSGGTPQVNSDWAAASGVAQILNKPTLFSGAYSSLTGVPTTFTPAAHTQAFSTITSTPTTCAGYGITDCVTPTSLTSTLSGYTTTSSLTSTLSSYATTSALGAGLATKFNLPAGTTSQYVRGDGSLATLPLQTQFNYGQPTTRTIALATAYQALDPTKATAVTVTLDCTITGVISVTTTCAGEVRSGTTNAVSTGSGTIVGTYKESVGLSVINNLGQQSTITILLPIGQYFAVRQTSGTGLTVTTAVDQSAQ